ncbi:MAG: DMT family transporter [Pseudomonadota bacterium]
MEQFICIMFVALVGAFMAIQPAVNAALSAQWAKSSLLAATASFAVGLVALVACLVVTRTSVPWSTMGTTSWWHWLGGLMGACFVVVLTYAAPKLGAVTISVVVVAAQLMMAVILDHFGLFGYAQRNFDIWRGLGLVLVFFGVLLVRR